MNEPITAEQLEVLRRKWEESMGLSIRARRIRSIDVNSSYKWQPPLHIEVGKKCSSLWKDTGPELVVAIFESRMFLVCTPDHGVDRGSPHIFTRDDVRVVTPWE